MSVDLAAGSTLAGLRVERLLGRGAMGAVYLAEDVHLKRRSAIKVLGPELAEDERFRRRFLLESQLAASLDHPHIVPIYAVGPAGLPRRTAACRCGEHRSAVRQSFVVPD